MYNIIKIIFTACFIYYTSIIKNLLSFLIVIFKKYEFVPREYQLELLNEIKKCNTILYLPTGSGKTYIATMLIKDFGESLNRYS